MEDCLGFLNFDGLDDVQVLHLKEMLHPSNFVSEIEFPWDDNSEEKLISKGNISSLNVHAPAFQSHVPLLNNHASTKTELHNAPAVSYTNGSSLPGADPVSNDAHYHPEPVDEPMRTLQPAPQSFPKSQKTLQQNACDQQVAFSQHPKTFEGDFYPTVHENQQVPSSVSSFKLNPTVSCFIPQNMVIYPTQTQQPVNGLPAPAADSVAVSAKVNHKVHEETEPIPEQSAPTNLTDKVTQNGLKQNVEPNELNADALNLKDETASANKPTVAKAEEPVAPSKPVGRSWADIVSKGPKPAKVTITKPSVSSNEVVKNIKVEQEKEVLLLAEDKMSFALGKHLHEVKLDFHPVLLQPRGLINRRNWCYINACLQALLACSPFYTLLRDLPLGPGVDRGKSSTPVIDSMVKVTYEFSRYDTSQEELQLGPPFQPDFMYEMLSDLKSDCLKGQQEDAEEFLSFILNGMHEEMVKIIKNYQKKTNIKIAEEVNGDIGDEGDEWQVIQVGSKNKGMVTRKVVEHRTPISDLLGGQIKSFLTTKTVKTASIQPFFTLQLDIQSDNVTSVSEALKEMTVKVPIQGYVCAKSKQEVEAFNHVALQKLPPILILHLKRFVYNKNGGCKKVMKKTDYPLVLDISKDILSSDVKNENLRPYKLFAVMYHDGEEAVKGHYISDVYNHGSKTWIRCDDRSVTAVTEDQVLSYSPPRVPYLLFYQES